MYSLAFSFTLGVTTFGILCVAVAVRFLFYWADPTVTLDPPVAQAFGPEQFSDGDSVSDVSG